MSPHRALVLLKSGRRINLLNPEPGDWDDTDLAIGLARTYRWGGHSAWALPLSVAQHSLTVLALRRAMPGPALAPAEALRELLHDADEGFLSFDCITPLKQHLGDGYAAVVRRLQAAIADRYHLPPRTAESYERHKQADRLAAASEACHVVGWSAYDIRHSLEIDVRPLAADPLTLQPGMRPWEPWPADLAAHLFAKELVRLRSADARTRPDDCSLPGEGK